MELPNRIRELRTERGLTLDQVAESAGTSNQEISRLELGHRRLTDRWMRRLSAALNCRPCDLLAETVPEYHPQIVRIAVKAAVAEYLTADISERIANAVVRLCDQAEDASRRLGIPVAELPRSPEFIALVRRTLDDAQLGAAADNFASVDRE